MFLCTYVLKHRQGKHVLMSQQQHQQENIKLKT